MSLIQTLFTDLQTYYNLNYRKYTLMNPFFCRNSFTLTWNNYLGLESFDRYEDYYLWAIDNNQYSLMMEDESLIQLFYEVNLNDDSLVRASITFLPSLETYTQEKMTYLRFDCDMSEHRDYWHTAYHAHFGYNSEMRISLYNFPLPSQFINFILLLYEHKEIDPAATNFIDIRQIQDIEECGYKFFHYLKLV